MAQTTSEPFAKDVEGYLLLSGEKKNGFHDSR
jgi:hypothetical protein